MKAKDLFQIEWDQKVGAYRLWSRLHKKAPQDYLGLFYDVVALRSAVVQKCAKIAMSKGKPARDGLKRGEQIAEELFLAHGIMEVRENG